MIPLWVAPFTQLSVLVTRPAAQAAGLRAGIEALGGEALLLPVINITPRAATVPDVAHDLVIFTSANAVTHGLHVLKSQMELAKAQGMVSQLAAVGAATATALTEQGYHADLVPAMASSEGLLAEAALQRPPARVLLVRGTQGRDLLPATLTQRGSAVSVCEVYERVPAAIDPAQLDQVTARLQAAELDVISATSVDTVHAVLSLLHDVARDVTLLAGSARIAAAAKALAWRGECIVSVSPEDRHMLDTLARWRMRARN